MSLSELLNPSIGSKYWMNTYHNTVHTQGIQFGTSSVIGSVLGAIDTTGTIGYVNIGGSGSATQQLVGSGNGTPYSFSTSGSAVPLTDVDGTNLKASVVIPTGTKLVVQGRFQAVQSTGSGKEGYTLALVDTSTSTVLDNFSQNGGTNAIISNVFLQGLINGDGNSHTISVQYALSSTSSTNGLNLQNNAVTGTAGGANFSSTRPSVLLELF